jgi:hypothetical protein
MKSRLPLPKAKIKKIVNDFVLPANIPYAYKRLIEVLKTVEKMRIAHGLVRHPASGDLVRGVFRGEHWVDQGVQMRRRVRVFPFRSRGAVEKPHIKYLTIMLGQIFYHSTGSKPKLAHLEERHSDFELFAGNFLKHYGISDCRGQLRGYIKLRKILAL